MNEKELTHISLFSGIGGFDLAGQWAGFRTVVFCEKEEFCQKVLQERFNAYLITNIGGRRKNGDKSKRKANENLGIPLIPDIRDFDGTKWRGATLLTGGFPCQPFSVAGKRKGKEDDRHLWPEMLRVIKEAKPRWVLAENVTGIVKLALGQVLSDLEGIGYDFPRDHEGTPIVPVIPACSLNAPHRRNRVWIIANTREQERNWLSDIRGQKMVKIGGKNQIASDTTSKRKKSIPQQRQGSGIKSANSHAPDSTKQRLQGIQESQIEQSLFHAQRGSWQEDWYEVAARFCRVDDGVPAWVHSHRVKRLKALGNAIIPQIAYEILRHIAWIERSK